MKGLIQLFIFAVFTSFAAGEFTQCGGFVSSDSGVISSPIGYEDVYPSDAECVWTIPEKAGYGIQLAVDHFQLEEDSQCEKDFLIINNQLDMKYCGTSLQGVVLPLFTAGVVIRFESDSNEERHGFTILYDQIHSPTCEQPCEHGGTCVANDTCECDVKWSGYGCTYRTWVDTATLLQNLSDTSIFPSDFQQNRQCAMYGHKNVRTFDAYHFQIKGSCEYQLTAFGDTRILVMMNAEDAPGMAPIKALTIHVGAHSVKLLYSVEDDEVIVQDRNRRNETLPIGHGGFQVYRKYGAVWVQNDEFKLNFKDGNSVSVTVWPHDPKGLCGNANKDGADDMMMSHGDLARNDQMLAKSWSQDPQCTSSTKAVKLDDREETEVEAICRQILSDSFSDCLKHLPVMPYMHACHSDMRYCNYKRNPNCDCSSFEQLARDCTLDGHQPDDNWRKFRCGKKCPQNQVFSQCAPACPKTCESIGRTDNCHATCVDGCTCPEGLYLDGDRCVQRNDCSCMVGGKRFAKGDTRRERCKDCVCIGGVFDCKPKKDCPGIGLAHGSQFYLSFDGKWINNEADCEYFLLRVGTTLDVVIDSEACGKNGDFTCIKSISITMHAHSTITITKDWDVQIKGSSLVLPYADYNTVEIRELTSMWLVVHIISEDVIIHWAYGGIIFVTVPSKLKGKTSGLLGDYNGITANDLTTPTGIKELTAASFIASWKTAKACKTPTLTSSATCSRKPEQDQKCKLALAKLLEGCPRTFIDYEVAMRQCEDSACSSDTVEEMEKSICASVSVFAAICALSGHASNWRPSFCNVTCSNDKEYKPWTSSCGRTCYGIQNHEDCTAFGYAEGCVCPDGLYENKDGTCVNKQECMCFYEKSWRNNEELFDLEERKCQCVGGTVTCTQAADHICPGDKTWQSCTAGEKGVQCQPTCADRSPVCSRDCVPGCGCANNTIAEGDSCIQPNDCMCMFGDEHYKNGDTVQDDCDLCTCEQGTWKCMHSPTLACTRECSLVGGHYVTFDGRRYYSHGPCEYILVTDACMNQWDDYNHFEVHVKSIACEDSDLAICNLTVHARIGNYVYTLRDGQVEQTNADAKDQSGLFDYWTIMRDHMGMYYVIQASFRGRYYIQIRWDYKTRVYVQVSYNITETTGRKVCGLCGNLDDNAANDLEDSRGVTVADPSAFVNAWKLSDDCPDVGLLEENPCSGKIDIENSARRRCKILLGPLFKSCHSKIDPKSFYDTCVRETCSCEMGGECECYCTAVSDYADACGRRGALTYWRSATVCPAPCDEFTAPNASLCDIKYSPCQDCLRVCCKPCYVGCFEGCFPNCKDGKFYDPKNDTCVPEDECGECNLGPPPKEGTTPEPTTISVTNASTEYTTTTAASTTHMSTTTTTLVTNATTPYQTTTIEYTTPCAHFCYSPTGAQSIGANWEEGCVNVTCKGDSDGCGYTERADIICPSEIPDLCSESAILRKDTTGSCCPAYSCECAEPHTSTAPEKCLPPYREMSTRLPKYNINDIRSNEYCYNWTCVCPLNQDNCRKSVKCPTTGCYTVDDPDACGCIISSRCECDVMLCPPPPTCPRPCEVARKVSRGEVAGLDRCADDTCCPQYQCQPNCTVPTCEDYEERVLDNDMTCCPTYKCQCARCGSAGNWHNISDSWTSETDKCIVNTCASSYCPSAVVKTNLTSSCHPPVQCSKPWLKLVETNKDACCPTTRCECNTTLCPADPECESSLETDYEMSDDCCEVNVCPTCTINGKIYQKDELVSENGCLPKYCRCTGSKCSVETEKKLCPEDEICSNKITLPYTFHDGCCWVKKCKCDCSVWGDPHYSTFDGKMYDFQGLCQYVLVQSRDDDLQIITDNKHCLPGANEVSCLRDILIIWKGTSVKLAYDGTIMINNVRQSKFFSMIRKNGIILMKAGDKTYLQIPKISLTLKIWGDVTQQGLTVSVPMDEFFNKSVGLCGTCTNSTDDDYEKSTGEKTPDVNDFAYSWSYNATDEECTTRKPCEDMLDPGCWACNDTRFGTEDYPMPEHCKTKCNSTCDVLNSEVFKACRNEIDVLGYLESCEFDENVLNKCPVCDSSAIHAFSAACSCIPWREHYGCGKVCPAGQEYRECVSECRFTKTCQHVLDGTMGSRLCNENTGSACVCPEGQVLRSADSDVCVNESCCDCENNIACGDHQVLELDSGAKVTDCCPKKVCRCNACHLGEGYLSLGANAFLGCQKYICSDQLRVKDGCFKPMVMDPLCEPAPECECFETLQEVKAPGNATSEETWTEDCCPTYKCEKSPCAENTGPDECTYPAKRTVSNEMNGTCEKTYCTVARCTCKLCLDHSNKTHEIGVSYPGTNPCQILKCTDTGKTCPEGVPHEYKTCGPSPCNETYQTEDVLSYEPDVCCQEKICRCKPDAELEGVCPDWKTPEDCPDPEHMQVVVDEDEKYKNYPCCPVQRCACKAEDIRNCDKSINFTCRTNHKRRQIAGVNDTNCCPDFECYCDCTTKTCPYETWVPAGNDEECACNCTCDKSKCKKPKVCKTYEERFEDGSLDAGCCMEYGCRCDTSKCPPVASANCDMYQEEVVQYDVDNCCPVSKTCACKQNITELRDICKKQNATTLPHTCRPGYEPYVSMASVSSNDKMCCPIGCRCRSCFTAENKTVAVGASWKETVDCENHQYTCSDKVLSNGCHELKVVRERVSCNYTSKKQYEATVCVSGTFAIEGESPSPGCCPRYECVSCDKTEEPNCDYYEITIKNATHPRCPGYCECNSNLPEGKIKHCLDQQTGCSMFERAVRVNNTGGRPARNRCCPNYECICDTCPDTIKPYEEIKKSKTSCEVVKETLMSQLRRCCKEYELECDSSCKCAEWTNQCGETLGCAQKEVLNQCQCTTNATCKCETSLCPPQQPCGECYVKSDTTAEPNATAACGGTCCQTHECVEKPCRPVSDDPAFPSKCTFLKKHVDIYLQGEPCCVDHRAIACNDNCSVLPPVICKDGYKRVQINVSDSSDQAIKAYTNCPMVDQCCPQAVCVCDQCEYNGEYIRYGGHTYSDAGCTKQNCWRSNEKHIGCSKPTPEPVSCPDVRSCECYQNLTTIPPRRKPPSDDQRKEYCCPTYRCDDLECGDPGPAECNFLSSRTVSNEILSSGCVHKNCPKATCVCDKCVDHHNQTYDIGDVYPENACINLTCTDKGEGECPKGEKTKEIQCTSLTCNEEYETLTNTTSDPTICCPQQECVCKPENMLEKVCKGWNITVEDCPDSEHMEIYENKVSFNGHKCCPKKECRCKADATCEQGYNFSCKDNYTRVTKAEVTEDNCCPDFECICNCTAITCPYETWVPAGNDEECACNCTCDKSKCKKPKVCKTYEERFEDGSLDAGCCMEYGCRCDTSKCPPVASANCDMYQEEVVQYDVDNCCPVSKTCACKQNITELRDICKKQNATTLPHTCRPGYEPYVSMASVSSNDKMCCPIGCRCRSCFTAENKTVAVGASWKETVDCENHQYTCSDKVLSNGCHELKVVRERVSCNYTSKKQYEATVCVSGTFAIEGESPSPGCCPRYECVSCDKTEEPNCDYYEITIKNATHPRCPGYCECNSNLPEGKIKHCLDQQTGCSMFERAVRVNNTGGRPARNRCCPNYECICDTCPDTIKPYEEIKKSKTSCEVVKETLMSQLRRCCKEYELECDSSCKCAEWTNQCGETLGCAQKEVLNQCQCTTNATCKCETSLCPPQQPCGECYVKSDTTAEPNATAACGGTCCQTHECVEKPCRPVSDDPAFPSKCTFLKKHVDIYLQGEPCCVDHRAIACNDNCSVLPPVICKDGYKRVQINVSDSSDQAIKAYTNCPMVDQCCPQAVCVCDQCEYNGEYIRYGGHTYSDAGCTKQNCWRSNEKHIGCSKPTPEPVSCPDVRSCECYQNLTTIPPRRKPPSDDQRKEYCCPTYRCDDLECGDPGPAECNFLSSRTVSNEILSSGCVHKNCPKATCVCDKCVDHHNQTYDIGDVYPENACINLTCTDKGEGECPKGEKTKEIQCTSLTCNEEYETLTNTTSDPTICCPQQECVCKPENMLEKVCKGWNITVEDCPDSEHMEIYENKVSFNGHKCCPKKECRCKADATCEQGYNFSCKDNYTRVTKAEVTEDNCCPDFECICNCTAITCPYETWVPAGNDEECACNCTCDKSKCKKPKVCKTYEERFEDGSLDAGCCMEYGCRCDTSKCPPVASANCDMYQEEVVQYDVDNCCPVSKTCACKQNITELRDICKKQNATTLPHTCRPGYEPYVSMASVSSNDKMCCPIGCRCRSCFTAENKTVAVGASWKETVDCENHQYTCSDKVLSNGCHELKVVRERVSCNYTSKKQYEATVCVSGTFAIEGESPSPGCCPRYECVSCDKTEEPNCDYYEITIKNATHPRCPGYCECNSNLPEGKIKHCLDQQTGCSMFERAVRVNNTGGRPARNRCCPNYECICDTCPDTIKPYEEIKKSKTSCEVVKETLMSQLRRCCKEYELECDSSCKCAEWTNQCGETLGCAQKEVLNQCQCTTNATCKCETSLCPPQQPCGECYVKSDTTAEPNATAACGGTCCQTHECVEKPCRPVSDDPAFPSKCTFLKKHVDIYLQGEPCCVDHRAIACNDNCSVLPPVICKDGYKRVQINVSDSSDQAIKAYTNCPMVDQCCPQAVCVCDQCEYNGEYIRYGGHTYSDAGCTKQNCWRSNEKHIGCSKPTPEPVSCPDVRSCECYQNLTTIPPRRKPPSDDQRKEYCCPTYRCDDLECGDPGPAECNFLSSRTVSNEILSSGCVHKNCPKATCVCDKCVDHHNQTYDIGDVYPENACINLTCTDKGEGECPKGEKTKEIQCTSLTCNEEYETLTNTTSDPTICCPQQECVCKPENMLEKVCKGWNITVEDCPDSEHMEIYKNEVFFNEHKCCPRKECRCKADATCEKGYDFSCKANYTRVIKAEVTEDNCCPDFECICNCSAITCDYSTYVAKQASEDSCNCVCECDLEKCEPVPVCPANESPKQVGKLEDGCCPNYECRCNASLCPSQAEVNCAITQEKVMVANPNNTCCPLEECRCSNDTEVLEKMCNVSLFKGECDKGYVKKFVDSHRCCETCECNACILPDGQIKEVAKEWVEINDDCKTTKICSQGARGSDGCFIIKTLSSDVEICAQTKQDKYDDCSPVEEVISVPVTGKCCNYKCSCTKNTTILQTECQDYYGTHCPTYKHANYTGDVDCCPTYECLCNDCDYTCPPGKRRKLLKLDQTVENCCYEYECLCDACQLENGTYVDLDKTWTEEIHAGCAMEYTCQRSANNTCVVQDRDPRSECRSLKEYEEQECQTPYQHAQEGADYMLTSPCCRRYECVCNNTEMNCPRHVDTFSCPASKMPVQHGVVKQTGECCYDVTCECKDATVLKNICDKWVDYKCSEDGYTAYRGVSDDTCCPNFTCTCDTRLCSNYNFACQAGFKRVENGRINACCPDYSCECDACILDQVVHQMNTSWNDTCNDYECNRLDEKSCPVVNEKPKYSCGPVDEADCHARGGVVRGSAETNGCCQECTLCKLVEKKKRISRIIDGVNCTSVEAVVIGECEGSCPTISRINPYTKKVEGECRCCEPESIVLTIMMICEGIDSPELSEYYTATSCSCGGP